MQIIASYIVFIWIAVFCGQADLQQAPKSKTTQITFDILSNTKSIGQVTAKKIVIGNKVILDLHTITDSKVLMVDIHVESEINLVYINKVLTKGIAYRYANRGDEDVESRVVKADEHTYTIERNGETRNLKAAKIDFCVVDLYFSEPKNRKVVFSTMYGQYLELVHQGTGEYKTKLPDNKDAVYFYKNGRLEAVEVALPLGKVVSKRIN